MTSPLDGPPDIHRWPDPDWADRYREQVVSQGWRAVAVNTDLRWDKAGFLAACRATFGFPGWFGMNWDALDDALSDVVIPAHGILVTWWGWGGMARMYPADFAVATDILRLWVTRSRERGATVLVSLVGLGPDVELTAR